MQRNNIALLEQRFERINQLDRAQPHLRELFRVGISIIGDDRYAEREQTAR